MFRKILITTVYWFFLFFFSTPLIFKLNDKEIIIDNTYTSNIYHKIKAPACDQNDK